MSLKATQVPGNRLEVEQQTTVYLDSPGGEKTEVWDVGFISPPVYSWVKEGGQLFWMVGELPPFRYVKHDPDKLDIVPDSGGAQYLNDNESGGFISGISNFLDIGIKNFDTIILVTFFIVLAFFGTQIMSFLKN